MPTSHSKSRTATALILAVAMAALNLVFAPVAAAAEGSPLVTFSASTADVIEDAGTLVLTVELDVPVSDSNVLVTATTAAGTAVEDGDYAGFSTDVVILAGETSATVPVTILDDNQGVIGDADFETFDVDLSLPRLPAGSDSTATPTLGTPDSVTVTIADDDVVAVADLWDPTGEDLTLVTNMNQALPVSDPGLLANDSNRADAKPTDVPNKVASTTVVSPTGTVLANPDGSFVLQPGTDFVGEATFSYTVTDNTDIDTALVAVRVNGLVTATPDSYTVEEDGLLSSGDAILSLIANDSDGDTGYVDPMTVTASDTESLRGGAVEVDADGHFTYDPPKNFNGTDSFDYTVDDGFGSTATSTATITVTAVNDAPTATPAAQSVVEDAGIVTLQIADWTTETGGPDDGDPELDQTLTYTLGAIVQDGANPVVFDTVPSIVDGVIAFEVDAQDNGQFTIPVVITDDGDDTAPNQDTTTVDVVVTVGVVNDAPTYTLIPQTLAEDPDPAAQSVAKADWITAINDGDPEETQNLTIAITGSTNPDLFAAASAPALGADDALTFTPAANANGTATVTVTVTDDGTTNSINDFKTTEKTFTITVGVVNDAPTYTLIPQTLAEDPDPAAQSVAKADWITAINDGDPEETQNLTIAITGSTNPDLFAADSAPALGADDALTFTPATNANGTATVTVALTDDGTTNSINDFKTTTKTFTITVTEVNDTPVFTLPDPADQTVAEDPDPAAQTVADFYTGAGPGGGPDETGQTLTLAVTNNNADLFAADSAPAIDEDGTLTYTPATNANGTATVTVALTDNGTTNSINDFKTTTKTFTITVTEVNDAPTYTLIPQTLAEDPDPAAQSVAKADWITAINDGDPEETQNLTIAITGSTNPDLFAAASAPALGADDALTFTPAANANGTATVTVTVTDNGTTNGLDDPKTTEKTFTITVGVVNDAPTYTLIPQTLAEDPDPAAQSVAKADWITAINDGDPEETQNLTIAITGSTNPDLFAADSAPALGADDALTFTPAANANGTATVTVTVTDDGTTNSINDFKTTTKTFTITVTEVNDTPVFTLPDPADQTVAEDPDPAAQTVADFYTGAGPGGGPDETGQTLTLAVTNNNADLFAADSAPAIDEDGTLTYTPATNANGTATVTVTVTDDGTTNSINDFKTTTKTFTITVTEVNDAPTYTLIPQTLAEDPDPAAQSVAKADWITAINDGDPEETQNLTIAITGSTNPDLFAADSAPALGADDALTFTPATNANGTATVTVTVTDDGTTNSINDFKTTTKTFTITVTEVNDTPVFTLPDPADQTVAEDPDPAAQTVADFYTGAGPGGGPDETDQTLTLAVTNNNADLFAADSAPAINETGTLTYTPATNANGTATVTVALTDNGTTNNVNDFKTTTKTFTITVTEVNDTPVFTLPDPADQTVAEDPDPAAQTVADFYTGAGPGGGPDETDQTLTLAVTNNNADLFAADSAPAIDEDGTLTYTPATNANGTATVTVALTDNGTTNNVNDFKTTTKTFTITVTEVNDTPVFTLPDPADQTVAEDPDPAAQTVADFYTGAGPGGGPDETDQTLTLAVTNNNADLFADGGAPAIVDGTLTYTPATNANGTATVTVALTDNGTTNNVNDFKTTTKTFTITVTEVNDTPVFTLPDPADQTVAEDPDPAAQTVADFYTEAGPGGGPDETDQTLTLAVTNNNADLFAADSAPAINETGTLTYTPATNANGTATVTVALTDNGTTNNVNDFKTTEKTFTITVTEVDDPENALDDSYILDVDTTGSEDDLVVGAALGVLANDSDADPDGDELSVLSWTIPSSGAIGLNPDGSFDYDAVTDFVGTATFDYTMTDGIGLGDSTATVTLTVNAPPTRADGDPIDFVTNQDDELTIAFGDLTSRFKDDVDSIPDSVTFVSATGLDPLQGTVTDEGAVVYTPDPEFIGTASFTITVTDGRLLTTETVEVRINAAPVAVDDEYTLTEDGTVSIDPDDLIADDTDIDDAITTDAVSFVDIDPEGGPSSGSLTPEEDGTYTYAPDPDFVGEDSFVYQISDGVLKAFGTVTITVTEVNDAPTYTLIPQTLAEDPDPAAQSVAKADWITAINDGDPEETQNLTIAITGSTNPDLFAAASAPALGADDALTFTPAANANGTATVTVTVTDNGTTNGLDDPKTTEKTFTITVGVVNDAPTYTLIPQTLAEDPDPAAQSVAKADWITAINDGDPEETQNLTIAITGSTNPDLFAADSAPALGADDALTFTPATNANGTATVTVTVTDDGTTNSINDFKTTTKTFTITVTEVNDTPVFTLPDPADQTVAEDPDPAAQTVADFYTGAGPGGGPDETGQTLTLAVTNNNADLFAADSAPAIDEDGTLTYTPATNANGTATVTVALTDNGTTNNVNDFKTTTKTFTITVTEVNDTPVFTLPDPADQTVAEDPDPAAQTVADFYTGAGPGGGPDETDQTLTLAVTNNNADLFAADSAPAINETGTLTYTPATNANGTATVTVALTDNGTTNSINDFKTTTKTFTITVTEVNDAPTYTLIPQTLAEDPDPAAQSVAKADWITAINDGDPEETQNLTIAITGSTNPDLFAADSAPALGADDALTFTPAANANGTATVTVTVTDNGTTNNVNDFKTTTKTFTITITEVNDAPTYTLIPQTLAEDPDPAAQSVAKADWITAINDGDPEETQNLTIAITGSTNPDLFAADSAPALGADDALTFTPATNANGTATVTVTVTDDGTTNSINDFKTTTKTFTITVTEVNDTPVFTLPDPADQTVAEDPDPAAQTVADFYTGAGPGGGPDETGQTLTLAVTNNNADLFADGGAPAIDEDGTLTYTPATNANGTATVTVALTDNGTTNSINDFKTTTKTFTITVTEVNDTPVFTLPDPADQTVAEDPDPAAQTVADFYTGAGPGGGPDETDQTLTLAVTNNNADLFADGGAPAIDEDGTLTYTPATNANGTATVTVALTDNGTTNSINDFKTTTKTFTITVTEVNDAPTYTLIPQTLAEDPDPAAQSVAKADWITAINDGDPEETQNLTIAITGSTNPDLFADGGAPALGADDALTFTPATNANGTATVTVALTDNGTTNNVNDFKTTTKTFTITITEVNDTPVAVNDSYAMVQANSLVVPASQGLLVSGIDDSDVDGDDLTVVTATVITAAGITVELEADGSFDYSPPPSLYGTDTFEYTTTDGSLSDTATVTIEIERGADCVDPAPLPFDDVPAGVFYEEAVQWAVSCGVTTGTSSTTFSGNAVVNRGQLITFLWRSAGEPSPSSSTMPFTDVPAGAYYADAVRWAYVAGITTGTTATTFSPTQAVSRAQVVTLLHRFHGNPTPAGGEPFTDVVPGQYFYDAVRWAVNAAITTGTSATTFSPFDDTTRAQAVTFLHRADS